MRVVPVMFSLPLWFLVLPPSVTDCKYLQKIHGLVEDEIGKKKKTALISPDAQE